MIKFIIASLVTAFVIIGCSNTQKSTTDTKNTSAQKVSKKDAKSTQSKTEVKASGSAILCKKGSDERKLEIITANNGCQLAYTKLGETSNVASAASGTEYCDTVSKRIQGKLADAGYTCN